MNRLDSGYWEILAGISSNLSETLTLFLGLFPTPPSPSLCLVLCFCACVCVCCVSISLSTCFLSCFCLSPPFLCMLPLVVQVSTEIRTLGLTQQKNGAHFSQLICSPYLLHQKHILTTEGGIAIIYIRTLLNLVTLQCDDSTECHSALLRQ